MQKVPSVAAAGVVLALVTACSSSPAKPAADASTSPGASPAANASSNPAATPTSSTSAAPAPKATPAAGHTVGSGPGSKAPGKPTGFTRAGTYTYDVSGTATTRLGTQKQNYVETFAVDPPAGVAQKTTEKAQQGSRDQTLDATTSGLNVADIYFHEGGFNEDFKPVGTAVYFPSSYPVGTAWKWSARSTDGKYRLDVSSKITSTAKLAIQGQSLPTVIVDSVLRFTGSGFDLTDNQRDWVSTAYALVLKERLITNGTVEGFALKSDETRTIRSTTPSSS
jgi:hypothetical protein